MTVNDAPLTMEVDTGVAVSIISKEQLDNILPGTKLRSSTVRLKTYTGEFMEVLEETDVNVDHNCQQECPPLIVVSEPGPTLLGCNWLRKIVLDWKTMFAVKMASLRVNFRIYC